MSYIGQGLPADSFQGFVTDSFTGDGSATTFTLSKEPFSEDTLIVVINNVIQKPTTNFTVSGTTLTIVGTAVASGDVIYAIHMGGPLPIGEANKLDINGASDQLILDADGDTTISADTDDQIDFKAGGTDIFQLTATTATFNDGVEITTADNTDTLTLTSTDADANSGPNLRLYRNSGSPAVGDNLGQIDFEGRNDNSEDVVYASMMARARDETDGTEDGGFQVDVMQGGTLRSLMKYYSDGAAQELSFNDDSIDVDFRVESDGNTHMLFVDGGNDVVCVGGTTAATDVVLTLSSDSDNSGLMLQRTGSGKFDFGIINTGGALVFKGGSDSATVGSLTEFARLDASGNFLVGTTSFAAGQNSKSLTASQLFTSRDTTGSAGHVSIQNPNGGVGSITTSGSATAFNTSSDYRLKENVNYSWDATTELKKLKPAKFNFKADADTIIEGFLAHEVSDIVPLAVTGEKDAVDKDGNIVAQAIDQSKLVPLMVKTIQELEARIKTLEDA